jgi:hypothetical protein
MHYLDKLYRPEPWGNEVGEDSIAKSSKLGQNSIGVDTAL